MSVPRGNYIVLWRLNFNASINVKPYLILVLPYYDSIYNTTTCISTLLKGLCTFHAKNVCILYWDATLQWYVVNLHVLHTKMYVYHTTIMVCNKTYLASISWHHNDAISIVTPRDKCLLSGVILNRCKGMRRRSNLWSNCPWRKDLGTIKELQSGESNKLCNWKHLYIFKNVDVSQ